ncbi:2Fe-2S ferredoxin, partial [Mycobacterium sp. ITM-2017-0098]
MGAPVPAHVQEGPEVFAAEQERIFENMWFCAVRSSDLALAGKFKKVQVGRESVL